MKKDLIHFFLLWSPPAELYEFLRSCFQKPLVFFLLRDRRQCLETQRESSYCSNQKWHNVNKYTDYSAHLFCTMQLMRFIIQKTLWKPNKHSLSFVLMRVNRGSWWLTLEKLLWMISSMCSKHNSSEAVLTRNAWWNVAKYIYIM